MRNCLRFLSGGLFLSSVAFADISPLSLQETQYWVYTYEANQLQFNSPWDAVEGDAIKRDTLDLPPHAAPCVALSVSSMEAAFKDPPVAAKLAALSAQGSTKELVLLVNVVPAGTPRNELRKLDRDAYFSHWNGLETRPHLALSNYKKGQWIWEVIASPEACLQPNKKELLRYLDYALQRSGPN